MSMGNVEAPPKNRREAVWDVCNQLSAQGMKPSLRSVKMHYPRGSDTDVQKDVNAWYEFVFTQFARRRVIPALPDAVVKAMEAFWETASVEADSQFVKEREAHESIRAEMKDKLESALSELGQIKAAASKSEQDNVDLRLELSHRSTLLTEAEKEIEGQRRDIEELRRHVQNREQDLLNEMARANDAHERSLTYQREDFEAQVKLVREAASHQTAEHQRAMNRADEHYRDLERRSLVEVDAMRTQLKGANEVIERFRTLANERDIELASVRTELKIVRENHKVQIEELQGRNESLTREVEQLRAKISAAPVGPGGALSS